MKRIEALREEALCRPYVLDEFYYRFYKQYGRNVGDVDYKRYADAFYHAFSYLTPSISDGELVVGKLKDGLTDSVIKLPDSGKHVVRVVMDCIYQYQTARWSQGIAFAVHSVTSNAEHTLVTAEQKTERPSLTLTQNESSLFAVLT